MPFVENMTLALAAMPIEVAGVATRLDIIVLIGSILLALGFSFLCSIAEAALLSVTPSYIESLRSAHPKRAARLRLGRRADRESPRPASIALVWV